MHDITGQKFNRLTAVRMRRDVKLSSKQLAWEWVCECGKTFIRGSRDIRAGHTKSCGCWKNEQVAKRQYKHGGKGTLAYRTWRDMKDRCLNPNNKQYHDYGGRGITVCPEWVNDFAQFRTDMGEKPEGLTIERVDNDGPYSPDNCRWATQKEQANNTRKSRIVEYRGEQMTMAQLADRTGARYETARHRIVNLGWPVEKAIIYAGGIV